MIGFSPKVPEYAFFLWQLYLFPCNLLFESGLIYTPSFLLSTPLKIENPEESEFRRLYSEWEETKNKKCITQSLPSPQSNTTERIFGVKNKGRKSYRVNFQEDRKLAPVKIILSLFRVLSCFSWFILL